MRIKIIFILFFLNSCSIFIENFEKDIFEQHNIFPKKETDLLICPNAPKFSLISENKNAQSSFTSFIKKLEAKNKLSFIDKVILWSLVQINLRPDLSSPTSKLQFLISIDGTERYFNSFASGSPKKRHLFPYLRSLNQLAHDYKSKYGIKGLAKFLDQGFKQKLVVSKEFEQFLASNKTHIINHKYLKKVYIRGDETLKKNERIPRVNYTQMVKLFLGDKNSKFYQLNNFLFPFHYKEQEHTVTPPIKCNFDMGLYENSLFLISEKKIKSHLFGIQEGKNVFMAASSQDNTKLATIAGSFIFKGKSHIRSASICSIKNKGQTNSKLWLFSTKSRDPGQHLFHLLQYGINNIPNTVELSSMLSFSRHQFLKNPVRLVIESRKSTHQQLNELLKLNVPIYNAKKLGKIWGTYSAPQFSKFILDERRAGHLTCK